MSEARARRAWTTANIVTAAFFSGFLAIQVLVPIWRLAADQRPVRYGWQMYSTYVLPAVFLRETETAALDTVRVEDHVARPRGDIDVSRHLPAHICKTDPLATAIVVIRPTGEFPERYACR